EQDAAATRRQHARQLVDDGRLAGAVGTDQSMASAGRDLQRQIARHLEAGEILFQIPGFQRDAHGASLSDRATTALRPANWRRIRFGSQRAATWMRWRPTSTTTTST